MKLEDIKPGMTLWAVLTYDEYEHFTMRLVKGTVRAVGDDLEWPGYVCDWKLPCGAAVSWSEWSPDEVFPTAESTIIDYLRSCRESLDQDAKKLA